MTNKKEIIAHGVDVSECDFLWKEKLPKKVCNNGNLDCNCNSNPNCYFKQRKRKERECEELKEWKKDAENLFKTQTDNADKIISRYKQALEPFKDDYFKNLDTKTIAELAKKSIKLTTENRKFEDALDEIEENIKAMNNECFYDDICECNNCDMKNGCTYYRKFNILNIINKAKGGVNGDT